MTGRVVQEVLHHLVAAGPAAAAAAGGYRLRSRRPVRSGGGSRGRGQVGHGAGEAQLREGRPEVRGRLEENACLLKYYLYQNPNLFQHPVPKMSSWTDLFFPGFH